MATPQTPKLKIRTSAPGKVILNGEHSVVYGKLAVAASLGLRTQLEFNELDCEGKVCINFDCVNLIHIYHLQDFNNLLQTVLPLTKPPSKYNITHPELLNHSAILEAIKTFINDKSGSFPLDNRQTITLTALLYLFWSILGPFDVTLTSFELNVSTNLTIGAGTGSSASFAVTLAAFLIQLIKLKGLKTKPNYKSFSVTNPNRNSFDSNELELISKWAFQSECIMHGTPSGVDNTICTYGGLVEFRKSHTPKLVALSRTLKFILINTGISRNTRLLVERVAARRLKYKATIDGVLDCMDQIAVNSLECLKKINNGIALQEQYETLGELADMNHNLLACLGVSHPKLDEICLVLHQNGLVGKLTGAGGGGYAICLVPPFCTDDVLGNVMGEFERRGLAAVITDLGGCGVTVDI